MISFIKVPLPGPSSQKNFLILCFFKINKKKIETHSPKSWLTSGAVMKCFPIVFF